MANDGQLRLRLRNVNGEPLGETVDINLRHQTLGDAKVISINAARTILVKDLHATPQGLYRIEVDPASYLPVSQFVIIDAGGPTNLDLTSPVDPKKVKEVRFPEFEDLFGDLRVLLVNSDQVFSFAGKKGKVLYDSLDDIRKAGMLNIAKKAANTPLSNGTTVFPYITKLNELRGDRFFAVASKELREETKHSVAEGLFHPVDEALHHPPADFTKAGSFKTEDRYGNLQLSFFMKGDDCVVDADIDDAAGLEHVFQVLRNALTNRPTHPFDIHEILIAHQQLNPGYSFSLT